MLGSLQIMVGIQIVDEVVGEVEVGGIVVSLLNYLCSPFFFCDDECYLIFCLWCKKQMFRVYSLLLLFLEISVVK